MITWTSRIEPRRYIEKRAAGKEREEQMAEKRRRKEEKITGGVLVYDWLCGVQNVCSLSVSWHGYEEWCRSGVRVIPPQCYDP